MTPFYDHDGITLYHGDCREVLPALDAGFADVVVADPPYGETRLSWDSRVEGWIGHAARAMRPNGSLWCFGSFRFFLAQAPMFYAWAHCQELVWEKHNGSNSHADRFRRVHELVVQFIRRDATWATVYHDPQFTYDATARQIRRKHKPSHWGQIGQHTFKAIDNGPRLVRSVIRVPSCHGYAVHPTQKPIDLLKVMIAYSCPPDGVVLDPMAGVGSSLVAAKMLRRRAVGIELDLSYCEQAIERLSQGILPLEVTA